LEKPSETRGGPLEKPSEKRGGPLEKPSEKRGEPSEKRGEPSEKGEILFEEGAVSLEMVEGLILFLWYLRVWCFLLVDYLKKIGGPLLLFWCWWECVLWREGSLLVGLVGCEVCDIHGMSISRAQPEQLPPQSPGQQQTL
jgi:hypothetical protein